MKNLKLSAVIFITLIFSLAFSGITWSQQESQEDFDNRMQWWREARFGMFIHWGLYAVPAGEWKGETNHAEWIRTTAQIPLDVYDSLRTEFNPVKFNADEWVKWPKTPE